MQTRRQFGQTVAAIAAGAQLAAGQKVALTVRGVRLGAITGSLGPFAPIPVGKDVTDLVIEQCLAGGVGNVELVNSLYEPRVTGGGIGGQAPASVTPQYTETREALRQWR